MGERRQGPQGLTFDVQQRRTAPSLKALLP